MRLLYLAWKHAGADPFRLFNRLAEDYTPLEDAGAVPVRPPRPHRVSAVVYGFAQLAEEEAVERAASAVGV